MMILNSSLKAFTQGFSGLYSSNGVMFSQLSNCKVLKVYFINCKRYRPSVFHSGQRSFNPFVVVVVVKKFRVYVKTSSTVTFLEE